MEKRKYSIFLFVVRDFSINLKVLIRHEATFKITRIQERKIKVFKEEKVCHQTTFYYQKKIYNIYLTTS